MPSCLCWRGCTIDYSTTHNRCVTFCFLKTLFTFIPVIWQEKRNPSECFNMLLFVPFCLKHTLDDLIWFCRLEEGQYLIAHKAGEPFVTFLKATNGKVSRGAYNLQQVHSSVPQPPASGPVPWIPVDPAVVLPFHQKHGRVPCTFPLKVCTSLMSA